MAIYDEIIGHDNIISQLMMAVKFDKVSHAYIFNGPDGSGKSLVAKAFAQSLLCEKHEEKGCGVCPACRHVQSDSNPDLKYIRHEKPNTIGVDDVREGLVNDIQLKPYNGLRKVYIIDEAEKLSPQAQNAILKTIEEPPEYSVIIFLTNNSEVFLPTIMSRCITFNFRPIRESVIVDYLIKEYKIADYDAKVCATFSQGLLGRAIKLVESKSFNEIRDAAIKFVKNVYTYEIYDLVDELKTISEFKIEITDFIDIIEMYFRDVLLFKVTKDPNNLIFADEINAIRKQASKSSYEGIEAILNSCETAKARIKANVNFDLAMELMLLSIKEN